MAFARFVAAMLQLSLREPEAAQTLAEQSIALSDQHGFPYIAAFSRIASGRALAGLRRIHEGVSRIREGIRAVPKTDYNSMTQFLGCLAEAQELDGACHDALETIEQALSANSQERAWCGDLLRIRGTLRLKLGQMDRAEADFRDAIASARKTCAKSLELRAAMSLARMLRGNFAETRDLIAPLYGTFTERFDTPDLKEAKALLEELSSSPR
jgi:predicted ATPase